MKHVGSYNCLASKFQCVSSTQLQHSYIIPGTLSDLERVNCSNPGSRYSKHDYCYIYLRRDYAREVHFGFTLHSRQLTLELRSRRNNCRHRHSALSEEDRTPINIEALIQNASIRRNGSGITR
jgi:hypothetical protein